jgi:hypothetical protein
MDTAGETGRPSHFFLDQGWMAEYNSRVSIRGDPEALGGGQRRTESFQGEWGLPATSGNLELIKMRWAWISD